MTRAVAALLPAFALAGAAAIAAQPAPDSSTPSSPFALSGRAEQGGVLIGTAPDATTRLTLDGEEVALAPGGRFLIAFDRDRAEPAVLQADRASGPPVRQTIAIAPRSWWIENINVARRPGGQPSEAYRVQRAGELKRIGAARAVASASEGWRQRFVWPATGRISGLFGSQRVYRGEPAAYHSGVDVAPGAGAPVVAPADGIVVLAGPPAFSLEGNLIIIDHGMGLNSAFLHLATQAVREGQAVRQGQLIGTVGATGRATGPHLHWSMKWNDARIDPQALAGPMPAAR